MKLITEISEVAVPVRNLNASIKWYTITLGFVSEGIPHDKFAFMKLETGAAFNLWVPDNFSPLGFRVNDEPMAVIIFKVGDIKQLHTKLQTKGAIIYQYSDEGFAKALKFEDLDGNVLLALEYSDPYENSCKQLA
ncbi:VOC family protein [Paenibacillus abyssi]|uniref:Glyoxalase/fosfomycin resistance/dioxygenase domain-containing protein n=1 Tax=Paenibacillus abyssi TaxID=1340531 RepID=A0A917LDX5_9BACL|nr:VOC family protein [Paenibacillus abyssi]GGG15247.1 hypothetical protein GCM10010916_35210 [Paenibacillus abyssi]